MAKKTVGIRKRGDKWNAFIEIRGQFRSKTFETKMEAELWRAEQKILLQGSSSKKIIIGKTFADACDRYAREISPDHKGHRWEVIRLEKIKRHPIAHIQLSQLDSDDLKGWIADSNKKISPASTRREYALISSVLKAARRQWKWMNSNPCEDIDIPKANRPRDRRISDAEISKLLQAMKYEEGIAPITPRQVLAYGFLLALETAMRQGEIWGLTWEHVYLDQRYVTLPDTKNGTSRNVPLSKRAVELLKLMGVRESGKVFLTSQISASAIFHKISKKICQINDLRFHDIRHEALTRLARKLDVLDLARMVGHKDTRSLMIYYNATATEIAARLD